MLDSLPEFAELLLSNIDGLLRRITTAPPMVAANSRIMPQDPSTLTLAIVGFATLAVYFAATGWRPPRRDVKPPSRPRMHVANQGQSTERTEAPKRGAA